MPASEPQISLQGDWSWVDLTPDYLESPEAVALLEMAERFQPFKEKPSIEMTNTLLSGVRKREMESQTHAVHNDDELLGFYSLKPASARISDSQSRLRDVAEVLGFKKREPGVLLHSIVRSDLTEGGFGRIIVEHVIARTLQDTDVKTIFVEPANNRVKRMWLDDYHFDPVPDPAHPKLLYVAVGVDAETDEVLVEV